MIILTVSFDISSQVSGLNLCQNLQNLRSSNLFNEYFVFLRDKTPWKKRLMFLLTWGEILTQPNVDCGFRIGASLAGLPHVSLCSGWAECSSSWHFFNIGGGGRFLMSWIHLNILLFFQLFPVLPVCFLTLKAISHSLWWAQRMLCSRVSPRLQGNLIFLPQHSQPVLLQNNSSGKTNLYKYPPS